VPVSPVKPGKAESVDMPKWQPPTAAWPAGGTGVVAVDASAAGAAKAAPSAAARAVGTAPGGLPVVARASIDTAGSNDALRPGARLPGDTPASLRITVADRGTAEAVGVDGALFTVERGDGRAASATVALDVDYSGFAGMQGGDYPLRLGLVEYPACVLTTPGVKECSRHRPVPGSVNVTSAQVVSVDRLPVSGDTQRAPQVAGGLRVFAVVAAASGTAGDYTRTSLAPTSSWAVGEQGADFSYTYPLKVPPSLGGPAPDLKLSYSSGSVDGRSLRENSQSSWVGMGWEFNVGYIERQFQSCTDQGLGYQDLCWYSDNATMVFGGRSVRLIKVGPDEFKAQSDDGLRIERLWVGGNDTTSGEHWRVTDLDGVQYYFGRGYNMDSDRLDLSKWTWSAQAVPVYFNADTPETERCHGSSSMYDNRCHEAYRWNLDYVVDPRGNSMTYFYEPYKGSYGGMLGTHDDSWYTITTTLERVEYGTRMGEEWSEPAPMRVNFTPSVRCPEDLVCLHQEQNWPDTPWDLFCADTTPVTQCAHYSASFWTPYKLDSVQTEVRNTTGGYTPVDHYQFDYDYPGTGDHVAPFGDKNDTSPALWLNAITRTGKATGPGVSGGPVTPPTVLFGGNMTNNRVAWGSNAGGAPPLMHWRLTLIDNGSGGQTRVWYKQPNCSATAANPAYPSTEDNRMACWPQYYEGNWVWFHKNLVDTVVEHDLTGDGPAEVWRYDYAGWGSNVAALWAFDTNDITPEDRRSWSQWRGYPVVTTSHGPNGGPYETTQALFYRGMNGDRGPNGSWRYTTITDSQGTVADSNFLAGTVRERTTLDDGDVVASTIYDPTWTHIGGAFPLDIWRHRVGTTRARTFLAHSNTWRWTRTENGYDSYGQVNAVKEFGDEAVTGDETCTSTDHAYNTTKHLINVPYRVLTRQGAQCAQANTLLGEAQTFYDGSTTLGAVPTYGLATKSQQRMTASPATWAVTETGYDMHGRQISVTDARGNTSTIAYTPAAGGPVRQMTTTNPAGHATVTTLEPGRGLPVTVTDPNNRVTTSHHDALGRLVKVWRPGRSTSATPDVEYVYAYSTTGANSVATRRLGPTGNVITSYDLFDGRMRTRQAQTPNASNGRVITDVVYNDYGRAAKTSTIDAAGAPSATLVGFDDDDVPSQTRLSYDLLGRTTSEQLWSMDVMKWQTTYAHDGDQTTVTPPSGGASRTEWDAHGRTTKLRVYANAAATGTPETTSYVYNRLDALTTVTDPAGNVTTYGYDLGGRRTSTADPNTGGSSTVYNPAGDVLSSTDARGQKMSFQYDNLGRVTHRWAGEVNTGTRLASYSYDSLAKGMLTSSTRYDGDAEYTTTVAGYTDGYQPTGMSTTIPLAEGALAGTYSVSMTYNEYTGAPATLTYPDQHDAPAETLTYGYDALGNPTTLGGLATYVSATTLTPLGQLSQRRYGALTGTGAINRNYTWDPATGRLTTANTRYSQNPEPPGPGFQSDSYTYTPTGDITAIKDNTDGQSQCFTYDPQHRLTQAWTATDNCTAAPTSAAIAGSGKYPYWDSWTFDNAGRRDTDTRRTPAATTNRDYNYPATGTNAVRPHAMTSVTKTGTGAGTDTFTHDDAGNTATRTVNGVQSTYTFNSDNQFAQAVVQAPGGSQTTRHLYDADGGLLIRREPGATTLYAAGQEFRSAGGTVTSTRYYSHGGSTIAARTTSGLTWLAADHQGSANVAVNATTGEVQKRWYTPYGADRATLTWPAATTGSWPTDRGFLNKQTNTSTGLVDMGAREYDPNYGFISPDPLTNTANPAAFNPYAYSAHSPITRSDPTGLDPGGNCVVAGSCNYLVNGCEATGYKGPECAGVMRRPTNTQTSGLTQQQIDDYEKAKEIKKQSAVDLILKHGLSFLLDILGVSDIIDCFTKGSVGACISVAANALPITKIGSMIGKIGKGLWKAFKAWKAWKTATKWADDIIAKTDELIAKAVKKADDSPAASKCAHSFDPDTPVRMADGTDKRIADIKVGESVQTTDPQSGETSKQVVTTTHNNLDVELTDVTVIGDDGAPTTIETTPNHPFWVANVGRWVDAGDLTAGTVLLTADGSRLTVAVVRTFVGAKWMRDLTVNNIHTYYVIAGETPVLVHNCGDDVPDTLYHYTNEAGHDGILASGEMRPSLKANNPKDARYGDGQYLTDIKPGTKTPGQLSAAFLRVPWAGRKFTHYIEIDVRGLNVLQGRSGVFVVPNSGPLDLTGRIVRSGRN
jgi:RHS repeat-associated protein